LEHKDEFDKVVSQKQQEADGRCSCPSDDCLHHAHVNQAV
jgi:hypothetical protein